MHHLVLRKLFNKDDNTNMRLNIIFNYKVIKLKGFSISL